LKFSIITPCYNSEEYLTEMIKSVLQQSYKNFELIIVNDGSTDNSLKTIELYQRLDSRIILIDQKNSGKPSIARNAGIKKAQGDILCFLDSDDTMLPSKLQEVATAFNDKPEISIVAHDYYSIDENNNSLGEGVIKENWDKTNMSSLFSCQDNHYISTANVYLYFLNNWIFLHVNTVAIKRNSFELDLLLFNENMVFAEDIAKWCELLVNNKLLLINKTLATYRDTPNSLMTNQLQADLAALYFFESHLSSPLMPLDNLTKRSLSKKINKELLDSLHLASTKGLSKITFNLSIKLLKYSLSTSNIFKVMKHNLLATLK